MNALIIDIRGTRRERLADVVRHAVNEVVSVDRGADLSRDMPAPDLLLLHVGDLQKAAGDSIEALLTRFSRHSWILCYSGGVREIEAAKAFESSAVAVFPTPVGVDDPGHDFGRTVRKVLALLPRRSSLPDDTFKTTAIGFDVVLEAKLDVLACVMQGDEPAPVRLVTLRKVCPGAFSPDGQLLIESGKPIESTARLRRLLFHEESQTR